MSAAVKVPVNEPVPLVGAPMSKLTRTPTAFVASAGPWMCERIGAPVRPA